MENSLNKQTRTIDKLSDKISYSDKDKAEIINQRNLISDLENENLMLKNEIR